MIDMSDPSVFEKILVGSVVGATLFFKRRISAWLDDCEVNLDFRGKVRRVRFQWLKRKR
jgi:hypothetical protein